MTKRSSLKNCDDRINLARVVFLFLGVLLVARLFTIQVLHHKKYQALAQEQYWDLQEIPAKRGDILSSDGYPLATTQVSYLLYAEPKVVENKYEFNQKLSKLLAEWNKYEIEDPLNYYLTRIEEALNSDLYWVKIQGELSPEEKEAIEALGLKGLGFEEAPKRYYPEKTLASHVLGFVAHNEQGEPQGYFGIEGFFNGNLRGRPGRIIEEQDALGDPILVGGYRKVDSIEGSDIVLTINRAVQYMVEKRLKEGVEQMGALSGTVIVMDPFTGDIVAMANYPTYDPENFNDFDDDPADDEELNGRKKVERTNLAISQTYEPGSVFKPVTVATAFDLGKVNPDTTFVDSGPVAYSDYVIDNWAHRHFGTQTITDLLRMSNNIGAAWVAHQVGFNNFHDYIRKFGYGSLSMIDLEGEDTGIIRDVEIWTDIDLATMAFGQGISATPLQIVNSFNVLANGGNLVRPRIVKQISEGDQVTDIPPKVVGRAISEETSDLITATLADAFMLKESPYFDLESYKIAGKTGTAQVPIAGKYSADDTNATYVGYLADSRKFSMLVKLERPTFHTEAAVTSFPIWLQIADDLVKYYGIPADVEY